MGGLSGSPDETSVGLGLKVQGTQAAPQVRAEPNEIAAPFQRAACAQARRLDPNGASGISATGNNTLTAP